MSRNLNTFEWLDGTDINKTPLFICYWNVPFSELSTFDLMRLYHSFRKHRSWITYAKADKYEKAIKKELSTRENLNPCQKRAINKKRY